MLNVGDKIFISNYGAGIVLDISEKTFLLESCKYITIYLIIDDMDLFIPASKIENYKMRPIVDVSIIESALSVISEKDIDVDKSWNKRYRKNNAKIISGDIVNTCEVLRDLYYLSEIEKLPLGEKKILNKAENMVVSEIMLVFSMSISDAYEKLRKKRKKY